MNSTKRVALIVVLHVLALLFFMFFNIWNHEKFHEQNGRNWGCVDGKISYNWRGADWTCYEYSPNQLREDRMMMNALDSANEIATYNINSFAVLIVILSMIISFSTIKEDEDNGDIPPEPREL